MGWQQGDAHGRSWGESLVGSATNRRGFSREKGLGRRLLHPLIVPARLGSCPPQASVTSGSGLRAIRRRKDEMICFCVCFSFHVCSLEGNMSAFREQCCPGPWEWGTGLCNPSPQPVPRPALSPALAPSRGLNPKRDGLGEVGKCSPFLPLWGCGTCCP